MTDGRQSDTVGERQTECDADRRINRQTRQTEREGHTDAEGETDRRTDTVGDTYT